MLMFNYLNLLKFIYCLFNFDKYISCCVSLFFIFIFESMAKDLLLDLWELIIIIRVIV